MDVKLSFIIITYHRGQLLQRCIDSILHQENLPYPYEIIVIDNGGDAVVAPVPNSNVELIVKPTTNLGVAGGRNLGMSLARGAYWIFIDDDAAWHDSQDAARLVRCLEAIPQCGAVAVKILNPENNAVLENLLPHPDKIYAKSLINPTEVPYFYGGGHALSAAAVKQVGDYPSRYFFAMEEVDLCLRLIDHDYKVIYDPSAAIYHHASETPRSVAGRSYWKNNALNKIRLGWRLLPYPYPLTVALMWSLAVLAKTYSVSTLFEVWQTLWRERKLLRQERKPISSETVHYLSRIGARLTY